MQWVKARVPGVIQWLRLIVILVSLSCGFQGHTSYHHTVKAKMGKEQKARIKDLLLSKWGRSSYIISPHIPLARVSSPGPIQLQGRLGNSVPNWTASSQLQLYYYGRKWKTNFSKQITGLGQEVRQDDCSWGPGETLGLHTILTTTTFLLFWEKTLLCERKNNFYIVKAVLFWVVVFFLYKHNPEWYTLSYFTFKHGNILFFLVQTTY